MDMKFYSIAAIGLFLSARAASAHHIINSTFQNTITNSTGLGASDPVVVTVQYINIFVGLLALLAVLYILYAGFAWMTSAGNEEKALKAKRTISYTVVGLGIMLASWGITYYVITQLNTATH
jgi:amino acid transporter